MPSKLTLHQGIPENIQQEQQEAAPRRAPTTTTPSAPTATGTTPAPTDPSTGTGDAPINLFEAAAQANRTGGTTGGGGGTGGAARSGRQVAETARALNAAPGVQDTAGGAGNLDFLRDNPQFQQLRQIVQQQPQMLEPILQQVGAGNPELAQLIGQHQEQFLRLLADDTVDEDMPLPPGAQTVSVTEEERAAIERVSFSMLFLPQIAA